MPPARSIRQRAITNENDENSSVRLTRAKAAALGGPDDLANAGITKKALQVKKSGTNILNAAHTQRKRAALGDVSNVAKNESSEIKEGKKAYAGRATLISKATQNAGVQKLSRTTSSRSILGNKDKNNKTSSAELKRPASGSGVMGGVAKKRSTGSTESQVSAKKEDTPAAENEPPKKKSFAVEVEKRVNIETKEIVKVEEPKQLAEGVKETLAEAVPDLDAEDVDDPLMVAEYVVEIFDYLRDLEVTTLPNPAYMERQEYIDWEQRDVLIDYLIEVHQRFNLLPETLYLAVNIVDRFLTVKVVQLDKLQLVGITAMFIASKYEEVMSPHVSNFAYVAQDDYADEEILNAERYILAALNYDLSYPNPMNFLRRISKADNYDIQTRTLGKYLLEISVVEHRFIEYCPSHIAAAAMYMARMVLGRGEWDATLSHYAGYTEEEILPVFKLMVEYCCQPIRHEAFYKKYSSKKFLKASLLVRQWSKQHCQMYLDGLSSKDTNLSRCA